MCECECCKQSIVKEKNRHLHLHQVNSLKISVLLEMISYILFVLRLFLPSISYYTTHSTCLPSAYAVTHNAMHTKGIIILFPTHAFSPNPETLAFPKNTKRSRQCRFMQTVHIAINIDIQAPFPSPFLSIFPCKNPNFKAFSCPPPPLPLPPSHPHSHSHSPKNATPQATHTRHSQENATHTHNSHHKPPHTLQPPKTPRS